MKKTAITELIEFIQNNHSLDTSEIYYKAIEIRDTTEREQIEEAVRIGQNSNRMPHHLREENFE